MTDSIRAFAAIGDADATVADWAYAPRPLAPEDVDLRVVACGVCHSDLHVVRREWKGEQRRPLVPGHEIVGVVVRAGSAARHRVGTRVAVGTKVGSCGACDACRAGEENYCTKAVDTYQGVHKSGHRTFGGFAERVVVDSNFAFALPEDLPTTTAAPLMCAGVTVYSPLKRYVDKDSVVGVVGIGGLGHLGLQFARALGAKRVVAVTSSADKGPAARGFGADDVLVSTDRNAMGRAGSTFDVLLVTVSSDISWGSYLRLLKVGGVLCLVGLPPSGEMKLNPMAITARRLVVTGSNTAGNKETAEMLELAAKHRIRAAVELLPLTAAGGNEALRRIHDGTPRFRCVLVADGAKAGGQL